MGQGFPVSSAGKESVCNIGDPGSIPGWGRSTGEGIGYPLQYSWASLVAQLVKNPPAVRETWVPSLGWEDPLEKGKATHSGVLAWRIPWTVYHGVSKSRAQLSDFHLPSLHLHRGQPFLLEGPPPRTLVLTSPPSSFCSLPAPSQAALASSPDIILPFFFSFTHFLMKSDEFLHSGGGGGGW